MIYYTAIATDLDDRSLEKYAKGTPLRAIFNVVEMGRFNVEEIGTGRNIHPKANMGDAIDNDKGDRDIDTCRQRQRIASPPRLASPLSIATMEPIDDRYDILTWGRWGP